MAESKRQKNKIQHTIAEHCIPEVSEPLTFWLARDTGAIYFAQADGKTVCLSDLLLHGVAAAPPRHGRDGLSIKGEKGEKGDTVVGPKGGKGDSIVGPAGRDGMNGRSGADCQCATRLATAENRAATAVNAVSDMVARVENLRAEVANMSEQFAALLEVDKRSKQYVTWLLGEVKKRGVKA